LEQPCLTSNSAGALGSKNGETRANRYDIMTKMNLIHGAETEINPPNISIIP
jgi:hypothetical protein